MRRRFSATRPAPIAAGPVDGFGFGRAAGSSRDHEADGLGIGAGDGGYESEGLGWGCSAGDALGNGTHGFGYEIGMEQM